MPDIAVVGAGISGLHLALRLQQAGLPTTLYAERSPEELAAGRPTNLVVRFDHTRVRERALEVAHWDSDEFATHGVNLAAATDPPLGFYGRLSAPASAVDFRIYLPRLMNDYADRGGTIEPLSPDVESIAALTGRHELVVVASGRRPVAELFPRDPARSPYHLPQRVLCAGLFTGIGASDPPWVHFQLCPGVGEIFCTRMVTFGGLVHGMSIEAIPGGPLEPLSGLSYEEDPAGFDRTVLELLAEHAPPVRERIDERSFGLARPIDLIQGAITPTVRHGWAPLPQARYAVALGDAWVLNDPVAGQGANLGSHNAFVLADAILAGPPYDEAFCRRVEQRMWEFARPVTEWSNAFLAPPPPHALELLGAATADQRIADAFIDMFNDPPAMWDLLGDPGNTAAWLAGLDGRVA